MSLGRIDRDSGRRGRLRPVGRRGLVREVVQDEIKRYILTNNLRPGDSLPPEGELARQLGVGRNSVREAVKSLQALGILDVRVGQGLAVRDFTMEPVLDSMAYGILVDLRMFAEAREARQFLELGLVRRMIERVDDAQLVEIDKVLGDWLAVAKDGTYSPTHDRHFHEATWHHVENRFVGSILEAFWEAQLRIFQRVGAVVPKDLVAHIETHRRVRNALASKDETELADALRHHYAFTSNRLQDAEESLS